MVPGSTANLGGGFDTLGVALQLYLRARIVDVRDEARLVVEDGVVALVVVFVLLGIADFATEWMWFDSLQVGSVFLTTIGARVILFILGALVFFGVF